MDLMAPMAPMDLMDQMDDFIFLSSLCPPGPPNADLSPAIEPQVQGVKRPHIAGNAISRFITRGAKEITIYFGTRERTAKRADNVCNRTAGSGRETPHIAGNAICRFILRGTKEITIYFGTRERNRTSDQKFRKLLLYPLSYPGVFSAYNIILFARYFKA